MSGRDRWLVLRTAENIFANTTLPKRAERRVPYTNDEIQGLWVKWLARYSTPELMRTTLDGWRDRMNDFLAQEVLPYTRVVFDDEVRGADGREVE